jgi:hypothetical protein
MARLAEFGALDDHLYQAGWLCRMDLYRYTG